MAMLCIVSYAIVELYTKLELWFVRILEYEVA